MNWPRRVMSAVIVVAVLAVPPWLLATFAGPPLPGWPSSAQLRDWIADPLTRRALTAGLTTAAWILWFSLAYTVAVSAARRLQSGARWLRRVPLPTPWQAAATGMAGAAALTTAHTPTAEPPAPATPVSTGDQHRHTSDTTRTSAGEGVTVAGGWLPDETAQQITAAAALLWLRRRRTYQPGHPAESSPPTPLPATVTAVQAATAHRPESTPTGTAVPHLPAAGVALTGDGATDAARGVLITRLLAALHHPPDTTRVLITRAALTTLVGAVEADNIPGLRVVDTVEQATTLLSSPAHLPAGPDGDAGPPELVLLIDPSSAATAGRLIASAVSRARVVTFAATEFGHTWHVDRHGHTRDQHTGQPGPRLCVLDRTAATDLLTVLTRPTTETPHDSSDPDLSPPRTANSLRIPRQPAKNALRSPAPPALAPPVARLQVLGRPALLIDGQPVTIRRSAALQVLVLLAVHPEGANTTNLVHAIWPGLPAHTVTGRLYTTLSDLRTAIRAATPTPLVDHTDDRYHLNPHAVDVDLWRLHTAAHHAATTLTDPTPAWQTVIDTYTGDLAAGHTWTWIDPPREATRRLVLDAYTHLASTQSDPERRLRLLQDAIRVDPYNEPIHRLAAEHLRALGEPDAATRLLHGLQQRLHAAGIADEQPAPSPR
ncbi:hypothetical protein [Micromonospora coxensis]|uniref:hypothetical protein n=1 Tax=Micromonospora coxensis TaxID=356852 RepID=UPI00341573F3